MQIYQIKSQPHTYIVEDDDHEKQLGTVDEYHTKENATGGFAGRILYIARRFEGRGMFAEKTFPGFTAALQFVSGKDNGNV